MSLIAQGLFQRKSANFGFGKALELEDKENQQQAALDAQKAAGDGQMISTGVGIGGSFGVNTALKNAKTTKDAVTAANNSIKGLGKIGTSGGELTFTAPTAGAETLTGDAARTAIDSAANIADAGQSAEAALKLKETAELAETTGAVVEGAGAVAEGGALATETVALAEGAAASSSTLGTLSTIAAPVAIGLGVAFLLNKLFD